MRKPLLITASLCIALMATMPSAHAVKVADITRLAGQRTNVLTGLGLVFGLPGTGDGGDYAPAINPLREMLAKFSDPVTVRELQNVNNVAIVSLTATVPSNGARNGDRLDVYVTSNGAASSLKGGRLFVAPMTGPRPESGFYALSEGAIEIEDPTTPTVGVVKGGLVMEADLPMTYIENGRFTLILDNASANWTTASTIAKIINDAEGTDGEVIAVAVDPKSIVVSIPQIERERPDSFISRVQRLPVQMLPTEARVVINEKTGTLIVTGDVEISPVVISHKGLTISTIDPKPVASPRAPLLSEKSVIALDTTGHADANGKLQDLVNALEQLKVPAADRITIVKELHRTGKLHAKLLLAGQE